jgi:outer membrane protein OmpA-like peptidoglycan-associated protein
VKHCHLRKLAGALVVCVGGLSAAEREGTAPVLHGSSAKSVEVRALENDTLVRLKRVHFAPGSIEVKLDDKGGLENLAISLKDSNESIIELRGYADGAGTSAENLALSLERSPVVARFLNDHGIPPQRILMLGLGEVDPTGPARNPEHQRVDVRVFEPTTALGRQVPTVQ